MRMHISVTARAVSAPLIVVIASATLLACGKDAPQGQLRAQAAPEQISTVYFGTEYDSVQAALKSESTPQPQAF